MSTEVTKKGTLVLIKEFFGMNFSEMKAVKDQLGPKDAQELGSAIARQRGLSQEECSFEHVAY